MILKTTEKKIIDAHWEHHLWEPGYYYKNVKGVQICLAREEVRKGLELKPSLYDDSHNYEVYYDEPLHPDEFIAIGEELKKLEIEK